MTKLPPPYFFECPDHPKDGFIPQRIKAVWPSGSVDTISLCAGVSIFTDNDQPITTAPPEVVLALLDINGKNTTANELREKIRIALSRLEVCQRKDAMDLLSEALLISHD